MLAQIEHGYTLVQYTQIMADQALLFWYHGVRGGRSKAVSAWLELNRLCDEQAHAALDVSRSVGSCA